MSAAWRKRFFATASPEVIEAYRHRARERTKAWCKANPERVKSRKRKYDPGKARSRRAKRPGYRSPNDIAKSEARKLETAKRRATQKVESYKRKLARNRVYQETNKAKVDAYKAAWYQANKERILQRAVARYPQTQARNRHRRANDVQFALAQRLRARMQKALKACGAARAVSTVELLGCTVGQFRKHIERQFIKGMGWDNRSMWHLDHIRPIASFDLTDVEQQRACFHFTNIRPLWRRDNQQKSARLRELL